LTLPWDLAQAVAFDPDLCGRVFKTLADELARWQCARALAAGVVSPRAGSILEIQRFADGARCWPHAHLLAPDGVFYEGDTGRVAFHGIGPPRDRDVATIVERVTEHVRCLLARRARTASDDAGSHPERQLLWQCATVAPSRRVTVEGASSPRSQAGKARRRKPLCMRSPEGLELHAATAVKASDRVGLERLCRYLARPPICAERLVRLPDGQIEFRLKRTWKGGVRALVFAPQNLIARMAALIPRPHAKMSRFYGVFASAHSWRSRVVPQAPSPEKTGRPVAPKRPARMGWADLIKRVFRADALRCPYCSGRLRVLAVVFAPTAIQAILAAVHLADQRATEPHNDDQQRGPPDTETRAA
jgi:hypothetical protein